MAIGLVLGILMKRKAFRYARRIERNEKILNRFSRAINQKESVALNEHLERLNRLQSI